MPTVLSGRALAVAATATALLATALGAHTATAGRPRRVRELNVRSRDVFAVAGSDEWDDPRQRQTRLIQAPAVRAVDAESVHSPAPIGW
ncbi:hypothetical protein AB0I68_09790 [Streptomyces sp. NPDC050448]|uniref:hypothetical protein n=1 Tax=Streptomyces sp. NPDC050448 TaxID=3155404 RepID=UPI0034171607